MPYAKIIGTGSYLPKEILRNSDLEKMVDTSDEWILKRVGISQRHVIGKSNDTTPTMATAAAKRAIDAANIDARDIDLIVVATTTPYNLFPNTACSVQCDLGLSDTHIPAFDLNSACCGFLYALSVANQYIQNGAAKTTLVIGVDSLTKLTDWTDRSTCVLFGDGAGAVVLQASDEPGIYCVDVHADGSNKEFLCAKSGIWGETPPQKIHMDGSDVFKIAVRKLNEIAEESLANSGLSKDQIDWLVPHQANLRIMLATAKRLQLSPERVIQTVQEHGNTSAASVPLALDHGVKTGQIKPGHNIILEAFGAGFSWGAAVARF